MTEYKLDLRNKVYFTSNFSERKWQQACLIRHLDYMGRVLKGVMWGQLRYMMQHVTNKHSAHTLELTFTAGIPQSALSFLTGVSRIPFFAVYRTVGFKETEAQVYLTAAPITAKILDVERFTRAPDRFNMSKHRSVSKVCEAHAS